MDTQTILFVGESPDALRLLTELADRGCPPWFEPQQLTLKPVQEPNHDLFATAVAAIIFDMRDAVPNAPLEPNRAALMRQARWGNVPILILVKDGQESQGLAVLSYGVVDFLVESELKPRALARSLAAAIHPAAERGGNATAVQQTAYLADLAQSLLLREFDTAFISFEPGSGRVLARSFEQFLGHEAARWALPGDIRAAIHTADQPRVDTFWTTVQAGRAQEEQRLQFRVRSGDGGEWCHVAMRYTPIGTSKNGRVTQGVVFLTDITEQYATEQALKRHTIGVQRMRAIAELILSGASAAEIAANVVGYVRRWMNAQGGIVLVLDSQNDAIGEIVAVDEDPAVVFGLRVGRQLEVGHIVRQIRSGAIRYIPDLAEITLSPELTTLYQNGYRSILAVPMIAHSELIGMINFGATRPDAFGPEAIDAVVDIVDTLSVALQQTRLHERTEQQASRLLRREQYLTQLNAINRAAAEAESFETAVDNVTHLIQETFATRFNCIAFTGGEHGPTWHTAVTGDTHCRDKSARRRILLQLVEQSIATKQPLRLTHSDATERQAALLTQLEVTAVWVFPLLHYAESPGAVVLGFSSSETAASDDTYQHAQQAAQQASVALRNVQLVETLRRQLRELDVLYRVALADSEIESEDMLIEQVTTIIGEALYPDNFGVLLCDEQMGELIAHPSYRATVDLAFPVGKPVTSGVALRVFQTGRSVRLEDVRRAPDYLDVDPRTRSELCVPITIGHQILGVINAESATLNAFTPSDERLLQTLAGQLSTGLQRIRLFKAERRQRQEAENLRRATAVMGSTLAIEPLLDKIFSQLAHVVSYDSATIMLWQAGMLVVKAARGLPDVDTVVNVTVPDDDDLFQLVRTTRRTQYLPDAQADPRFNNWGETSYVHGWMGVPLIFRGEVVGMLTLDSRTVDAYNEADIALAEAFANQATGAIMNAQLYEAEQQAHATAVVLRQAATSLTKTLDLQTILETLLDALNQLVPSDSATVQMFVDGWTHTKARRGFDKQPVSDIDSLRFNIKENVPWQIVLETQTSLLIGDTHQFPGWVQVPEAPDVRCWLGVPLIAGGEIVGAFTLDKSEAHSFTREHQQLAETLAAQAAVAIQNAMLYEQVQQHADTLQQAVDDRTRELLLANERLQELDVLKSRFVSDVSHELRTPVTNISLYLDLLERGKAEHRANYMATLREETNRIRDLIEDILSLSRLEAQAAALVVEPVNLNDVVQRVLPGYQAAIEEAGLALHVTLSEPTAVVPGRDTQLEKAVGNLLSNAIKYNTADGEIHLTTVVNQQNRVAGVEIRDSGMGIPDDDMNHLFERFFRGRNVSQSAVLGTGLGLAIVYEIVDLHQGWIEVDSTLGEGSTFRIWLPLSSNKAL